ncbi:hypothetical protein [Fusobacterium pseudoperiodonticum]|uniref:hypothetical protein n=1 Tax=Fusobacterium pseudoperiodonticum TaxID=2663009 RepID=UPI000C1C41D1|nr:hypothetical protein [Fusobacterium pseudoperiodonticum]ATV64526.1 hypothetical protein CTM78_09075 [Fusobacterium pseudoperiodonticum]
MELSEKMALEMQEFNERYAQEIKAYSKLATIKNLKEIVNRLNDLETYEVSTIKDVVLVQKNNITVYFSFYDFEYTNHNIEIAQYHKGENYNLYVSNDDGFITLAELKEMSQMMTKVKAVADEVIELSKANGDDNDE